MVPDDELPVLLPDDVQFMPTGRSPLTYDEGVLHTTDSDGELARRETDTDGYVHVFVVVSVSLSQPRLCPGAV